MPPVRFSKDGRKARDPKKTLLRLLSYMKNYIPHLLAVMVCIVVSAIAQTRGSQNIGNLVDDYILPMVASGSRDFEPLVKYLVGIAAIFGNVEIVLRQRPAVFFGIADREEGIFMDGQIFRSFGGFIFRGRRFLGGFVFRGRCGRLRAFGSRLGLCAAARQTNHQQCQKQCKNFSRLVHNRILLSVVTSLFK